MVRSPGGVRPLRERTGRGARNDSPRPKSGGGGGGEGDTGAFWGPRGPASGEPVQDVRAGELARLGSRGGNPADRLGCGDFVVDRKSTRLNSSHRCISYAVF